jgi:hypothetical protein
MQAMGGARWLRYSPLTACAVPACGVATAPLEGGYVGTLGQPIRAQQTRTTDLDSHLSETSWRPIREWNSMHVVSGSDGGAP